MSTIILQRFANREYRLTQQSIVKSAPKSGDKYAEKQAEKYAIAVRDTYVLEQGLKDGLIGTSPEDGGRLFAFGEVEARLGIRSLDIIDEFQTRKISKQKGGWGHLAKPTSFTKNARHRLLEAGAIVDKDCGLNAWEVTLTLPGSTQEAFRILAENTGWIMNELTQIIRRYKCTYWFYVWELQKRGALHLHLLVASPQLDCHPLAMRLERRWWELLQLLSDRTTMDLFCKNQKWTWKQSPQRWQSHVSKVKKSVAAYFSKYAGKGVQPKLSKGFARTVYYPSRWWGCSSHLKQEIAKSRAKYTLEVSNVVAKEVKSYLSGWLKNPGRLKSYSYHFDLGKSKNGTNLGSGDVCINYYDTQTFNRMQTWEKEVWEYVCMIARNADMADADMGILDAGDVTQTLQERYADIPLCRREQKTSTTPPLPPHSQPSSTVSSDALQGVLRRQPTLAIRAKLLQYLAGGEGEPAPVDSSEFEQLSLDLSL